MVSTESTSQSSPPQSWSSSYPYGHGPWGSALSLLSSGQGGSQVNGFYKNGVERAVYERDIQEQNGLRESSMSPVSVASPWPVYGDGMGYEEPSLEPSGQQISYDTETMQFGYGMTPIDDSPSMYQLTSNPTRLDTTNSCPRSYPTPDLSSMMSREPDSRAFPPWQYTIEPQKQEKTLAYLQLSRNDELRDAQTLPSPAPSMPSQPASILSYDHLSEQCHPQHLCDEHSELGKDEDSDMDDGKPYAKLIRRALMSVPEHKMVLKEIYAWFMKNTDKGSDPLRKGWQNSVRHNLSMNRAFRKMERDSSKGGKKGFEWVLEEWAVRDGVESTTRYRKPGSGKRVKSDQIDPPTRSVSKKRKNSSSHKGGPLTKSKRRERSGTSCDINNNAVDTNAVIDFETLHSPPDQVDVGITFGHDPLGSIPGYNSTLPLPPNDPNTNGLSIPTYTTSPDFSDNLSPEPQSLDTHFAYDIEGVDDIRKDFEETSFFCGPEDTYRYIVLDF
ncbi:MAG: Activating transcription factor 7-interacting protein 1 [Watsoniomyces obsoletus]|nr:MAG: Activating transcription factor 7-interacting protein 1 [Watsoniomyces obsoletus]